MRVLVTGAAGFIGSHLSRGLLDRGYEVVGADNFETGSEATIEGLHEREGFEFERADLRNPQEANRAVDGVDYVLHQAAVPSVPRSIEDPILIAESNCLGTTNLLVAAREAGVEGVVVASSAAVYGPEGTPPIDESGPIAPASPYALSKYFTEELAIQSERFYGLETVALRYFNVFGPGQDPSGEYASVIPAFLNRMRDGKPPVVYGDGEQTRDFVYVSDVVEANVRAMTADVGAEVLNVGSGESTSVNELVRAANGVLGTDFDPVYEPPRPGDVRHSWASISKAREALGFEPEVGLRDGLRRIVEAESGGRTTSPDGHPE